MTAEKNCSYERRGLKKSEGTYPFALSGVERPIAVFTVYRAKDIKEALRRRNRNLLPRSNQRPSGKTLMLRRCDDDR